MVKVKVIRGVYIKGTPYGEGSIVDVSDADYSELVSSRAVERFVQEVAKEPVEVPYPHQRPFKGAK